MDLKQLQEDAIKAVQLEYTQAYAQGYQRALLDIRSALCFADDENSSLDVVLTLLEQQNRGRVGRNAALFGATG